jgi:hypothetical protein
MVPLGSGLWLPVPWENPNQRLPAGWFNALSQASSLALFARLHRLTGDVTYLQTADGLFQSFLSLGPEEQPWIGTLAPRRYLWFEHFAGGRRLRVLNAHAWAALALRDYWEATGLPIARLMTEAALTTLRYNAQRFRREGSYSWYNLVDRVAHANYHDYHIRQLRALAVASGDPWFAQLADLFLADYPV